MLYCIVHFTSIFGLLIHLGLIIMTLLIMSLSIVIILLKLMMPVPTIDLEDVMQHDKVKLLKTGFDMFLS